MGRKKLSADEKIEVLKNRHINKAKQTVYIGKHAERWNEIKNELEIDSNVEFAKKLLDMFEATGDDALADTPSTTVKCRWTDPIVELQTPKSQRVLPKDISTTPIAGPSVMMSTPVVRGPLIFHPDSSDDISSNRSSPSGVFSLGQQKTKETTATPSESEQENLRGNALLKVDMDVTIPYDWTGDEEGEDTDDVDYSPWVNPISVTTGPKHIKEEDLEEITSDDEESIDTDEETTVKEEDVPPPPVIINENVYPPTRHITVGDSIIGEEMTLVSLESLVSLANSNVATCTTKNCKAAVTALVDKHIGSATYLKWVCTEGHIVYRWCAQSFVRGVRTGDLMLSSATVLSGNNISSIQKMFKFMNTPCVGATSFFQFQRLYICPSIRDYWHSLQEEVFAKLAGKKLICLGDGRMDSPGFCAKYCTYTLLEIGGDVLEVVVVDKREVENKSVLMEKEGLKRALNHLLENDMEIEELATDGHLQIKAMMKRDYSNNPKIKHSFDVWHGSKLLASKMRKLAEKKENRDLLPWIPEVVRHFWYCAENCNRSVTEFMEMWRGTVHHVVNKHEWYGIQEGIMKKQVCRHEPLNPEDPPKTPYLKQNSPAHRALVSVVMANDFINNIEYYINSRHTGGCEVYNSLLLSYASKRIAFRYENYESRSFLAAIDHQKHKDRAVKKNKNGEERMGRYYNKRTNNWTVKTIKETKEYTYIPDLMSLIFDSRIEITDPLKTKLDLPASHPRRISTNIAALGKRDAPPTKDIVALKKSRFRQ